MLITLSIIILLLVCLITTNFRPSALFVAAAVALYATGIVGQVDITRNIVNTSVLTLLALVLASYALERTILLSWLSSRVFHPSYYKTLFRLGVSTALSSALLNNTAVVATLMGAVKRNQEHPAQKLLLPLSYFAILGGTLTLIGTSTNLVVNGILRELDGPVLHFAEFLPVGFALLISCGLVIGYYSQSLNGKIQSQLDQDAYFLDAEVLPESKLIGKTVLQNRLRSLEGLFLAEIVRQDKLISPVTPQTLVQEGDKLVFTGDVEYLSELKTLDGVEFFAESSKLLSTNLSEVIVSPESILVGKTLKQTDFRSRFDAAVVAIQRKGRKLSGKLGEQRIVSGDKLVLAVGDDFTKRQNLSRNFFFLSGSREINRHLGMKENVLAILGFLCAIALSVVTSITLLDAVVLYLIVMLVTKVLDSTTIRRRFPFELWMILSSALVIAQAFRDSGLARYFSDQLYQLIGGYSPMLALIVLFLATVVLTESITNTAAAAISLPIGLELASSFDVSAMPFIMGVAYAASACFMSPFGYQTNLMVMSAGGYKVKDFIKTGWKISTVYAFVALVSIPIVFPF